jgi:lysine biosynthesis protein LysW
MKKARCPACKTTMELEKGPRINNLIICPNCKTVLEIIRLDPPELEWADDPITSSFAHSHRSR